MESKKSYIPIKVFVSYLTLALLVTTAGWFLYNENKVFSETESIIAHEKTMILKVSNLLSNLYKTESLARRTIQSNTEKDFVNYTKQTDSLKTEIDSLKLLVSTKYQITLLDSVKYLLSKKSDNIKQLKFIKSKATEEVAVKNAINDLTKMEISLRKLRIEDLVQNPSAMGNYQRNVLKKYVDYLNQNIPDDSTNTLSHKASDSILLASKTLLNDVKKETQKRKEAANFQENKLLQNELSISEQLRKILNIIETEIIINTSKNNYEKETALKKTNQIVTSAAVIGLLLTVFFSILILNDFSKTQSYKKQLEIANSKTQKLLKNREQLISTVSHDLKTPLSTIVGYTELLGNSELNKKQLYFTKNIKGSSEYISRLVNDLLDFTQIEAGKITIDAIPFSLNEIIYEVAKSVQSIYEQKPIDLIIEVDEKLNDKIIGDPFRLKQILINIIGNAFKFTEKGTIKVEVKINQGSKTIIIKIEDSGIGIQKDKQQLIFEEFAQADESIEKNYGGTGLGLTISKKIIEILGGKLSLNSVFGKGSIFEIEIPLLFDNSLIKKQIIINNNNKILTVIIIDDDINLLNLTTEVLKQNNYHTIPFNNAHDALDTIKKIHFDFIITDIQMPNMDGFEFLEKFKNSNADYKNKPIIAVTGKSDLDNDTYTKAGFTNVVRKPYSPKNLLNVINVIFNKAQIMEDSVNENDSHEKNYSLTSLKSFLPNEGFALKEVLNSFIVNTNESLASFEHSILIKNKQDIKDLSHRMCPMFKQIEAKEISKILEDLELKDLSIVEIEDNFEILKDKIEILFDLFKKEVF
jgi:signal transduction histidine kinase/FixJ family two-component response regulator